MRIKMPGIYDEYTENEMFNIMVLSLVMGKYLAWDHDELLFEDSVGVIYAMVKKESSQMETTKIV
jgi:hypothetical protein